MYLKAWRLIDTGVSDATYNMAVDEALLNNFKDNDMPILRLYRWKPSISFGRFSKIDTSVDLTALEKSSLSYVRRISGGGILVHGGDISYSMILSRKSLSGMGVKESYSYLSRFLIRLYKKLDLDAEFAYNLNMPSSKSNICMAANEPYDIIIDGKKVGGNAQRYRSEALFQHGSVVLSIDKMLFENIFLEDSGLKNVTTLDRIVKEITYQKLSEALKDAFRESFNAELVDEEMSLSEQRSADILLTQKYSQKRWNIDAKQDENKA